MHGIRITWSLAGLVLGAVVLALFPVFGPPVVTRILIFVFVLAVFAASWDLVFGYAGQINLGPGFPFGMAGFTATMLMGTSLPIWVNLILGAGAGSVLGLALAGPSLRLRGNYLSMVTFAILIIAQGVALITTGEEGITQPKRFFDGSVTSNYYFALAMMIVSCGVMYWIGKSWIGLKFKAVREDQVIAEAMGINTTFYKLLAFTISTFFSGLAGAYLSLYLGHVDFNYFSISQTFQVIAMSIVGGTGTIVGSIIGAMLLYVPSSLLLGQGLFSLIVYAVIILVVMVLAPGGVISIVSRLVRRGRPAKRPESGETP